MSTYYNFTAPSALSFAVMHQGRKMFVNFSIPVNGVARYLTTDKELAMKICRHRWFRQGLIHVEEQREEETMAKKEVVRPATMPERPVYSILGKKMAMKIPASVNPDEAEHADGDENGPEEETGEELAGMPVQGMDEGGKEDVEKFTPENVTSFMEAKEYFVTVIGIDRSLCGNKEAIASLCRQYGVEFPNYKI